ncbi:MAG: GMC family oxidoreductase N-terminal domain-containing protein [Acidimicrobiales bacterium]
MEGVERLASPIGEMRDRYDVVVVGSGYGGSIVANRMARAGRSVCLLERGRERHPGEYPDTLFEAGGELRIDGPELQMGDPANLYRLHLDEDISVFSGCGLGGTSLVNANVSIRPDPRVFDDPHWPEPLRGGGDARLEDGYRRAEEMLRPVPYPYDAPPLAKLSALETAAAGIGGTFSRPRINVSFTTGVNHVGVEQLACHGCGDCVTGCNHGAKNTLLMNYLPDARRHGADIFCEIDVGWVEPSATGWLVRFQPLGVGRERFGDAPPMVVEAGVVVLAAGALGSTEILLRSAAHGLACSERVGTRFSGNGDVVGFAYNGQEAVHGVGHGHRRVRGREPTGPCITGLVDRRDGELEDGIIVEEGVIPGALASWLPAGFAAAATFDEVDPEDEPLRRRLGRAGRTLRSLAGGAHTGAVDNTTTFLVMGHDGSDGVVELDDEERLHVRWPGLSDRPLFAGISDSLQAAADALDAEFIPNPLTVHDRDRPLITVHPMGGCPMGSSATDGAVDHAGRVFRGGAGAEAGAEADTGAGTGPDTGADVHDGLYVCDAAVIPRSLGVNPLLTISALAERTAALLAADRGWRIDYDLKPVPAPASRPEPTDPVSGLQFTERMVGTLAGLRAEFVVTITSDDLDALLADPERSASIAGTFDAPALADRPLDVDGQFRLFVDDPGEVQTRRMSYRMTLDADDGRRFFLDGYKVIRPGPLLDAWRDTTTLFVTVRSLGWDGPVLATGEMHVRPIDFARQLTTMEVTRARSTTEALEGLGRFGLLFAGPLLEDYGGIFARTVPLDPDAPPRRKRPLRCGPPEVHDVVTADGVRIRLLRYQGGGRGPVVGVHGMGACSGLFNLDTIEPNLTEFLWEHGFDVWLLDWRASVLLPAAQGLFTADECARHDFPAAVARVREVTGADQVHWVVHCVGSIVFFMAALSSLEPGTDFASIAALQVALHQDAPALTDLKVGLHLPGLLERLGVDRIDARTFEGQGWKDWLFNQALRLYPLPAEERCTSAVCRRVTFLYSLCYRHENLNEATHATMHERMGVANLRMMRQLARCTSAGHLVDADGGEAYLPHVDRLAGVPITFLHGAENQVWEPRSTLLTYEFLRGRFGDGLYRREVPAGYGHFEALFAADSAEKSYPVILEHLERASA